MTNRTGSDRTAVEWVSRCPRCALVTPLDDGVTGCPRCAADGVGMPMTPHRAAGPPPTRPEPVPPPGLGPMWRWAAHLVPVGRPVSLGEGGTPLVNLDLPGVPGRILVKDERANPTGSFKDRLASAAVSRARSLGADTVAVASSGNAGLAVAAYAATAGLDAVLLATGTLPSGTAATVTALGARVYLTETFPDRWTAVRTGVERLGWFPVTNYRLPPVASHPAGVHAYRTIAFEIAESLGWSVPDWVVVPVSRGDGLFGVWSGFVELARLGWTDRVPRMLAVERFPSLTDALARGVDQPVGMPIDGPVRATSISDPQGTAMAVHTIRSSGGDVVRCDDEQLAVAWSRLAGRGHLVEFSSAAAAHGVDELARSGRLDAGSTAVLLVTAADRGERPPAAGPLAATVRHLPDPTDLAVLGGG
ncbi:pyridoxal-phosphate dependent enzyme [Plantactinospora sp. GCM10030261]|uniref:threonine synthase n=1 Tax=Plantactinospora sp. GCM10030261 TaxID=3273420 RepID=UPI0036197777